MRPLRAAYGAGPLHLLAAVASFAIWAYAFVRIFEHPSPIDFLVWFGAAIVLHDLIAFPLYSLLGLIAYGGLGVARAEPSRGTGLLRTAALSHVRVPAIVSCLLFVVWFPLILRLSEDGYLRASGQSADVFLARWLAITGGLFAVSALLYALRLRRTRRSAA